MPPLEPPLFCLGSTCTAANAMQCTSQCTASFTLQLTMFYCTRRNAALQCRALLCRCILVAKNAAGFNAANWHDWWLQFIWQYSLVLCCNSNVWRMTAVNGWLASAAACNPTLLHQLSCAPPQFLSPRCSLHCTVGNPIVERSLHCFGHFFTPLRWSVLGFAPRL